jgi:hypothetical protein
VAIPSTSFKLYDTFPFRLVWISHFHHLEDDKRIAQHFFFTSIPLVLIYLYFTPAILKFDVGHRLLQFEHRAMF